MKALPNVKALKQVWSYMETQERRPFFCPNMGTIRGVVYANYINALDVVNHKELLHRLGAYGVSGPLLRWLGLSL